MSEKSPDDITDKYAHALGSEFGPDYLRLKHDYFELRVYWRIYRQLFGSSEKKSRFLFNISGLTFSVLENSLYQTCLLKISRLLDPETSGRTRENLSFRRIYTYLAESGRGSETFSKILEEAENLSENIRAHRNTIFAHRDLPTSRQTEKLYLPSRKEIDSVVERCGELIKHVEREYFDSHAILDPIVSFPDERNFLRILYYGVADKNRREEERAESLKSGTYDPENDLTEVPQWISESYEELVERLKST